MLSTPTATAFPFFMLFTALLNASLVSIASGSSHSDNASQFSRNRSLSVSANFVPKNSFHTTASSSVPFILLLAPMRFGVFDFPAMSTSMLAPSVLFSFPSVLSPLHSSFSSFPSVLAPVVFFEVM